MSSRSVMSPLGTLPSVVMIRDVGSMPRSSSEPPPSKRDEFFDADAEDNASVSTLGFDDFESAMASSDNLIYAPYRPRRSGSWGYRAYNIGGRPRFYNSHNLLTSDIIIRWGNGNYEFYSEKAILSLKSMYFQRAFAGNFPTATSPVIDLGNENNAKHVYAMLRYLHGTPYYVLNQHMHRHTGVNLDYHIDMYLLGEEFDIPFLRADAAGTFRHEALGLYKEPSFLVAVERILGPEGPAFADQQLAEAALRICADKIEELMTETNFSGHCQQGTLVDESASASLILRLGARITELLGAQAALTQERNLYARLARFNTRPVPDLDYASGLGYHVGNIGWPWQGQIVLPQRVTGPAALNSHPPGPAAAPVPVVPVAPATGVRALVRRHFRSLRVKFGTP